jgi:superfamily II DNA or RNA helicase
MARAKVGAKAKPAKPPKLSRHAPPADLSTADWQRVLRQQFGAEQAFTLSPAVAGADPFFGDFTVANPQSKSRYRVAIRGLAPGENYCACPDFATNGLGTCKHVEFALATLQKKRGAKAAFARGWHPAYSSISLAYDGVRTVRFRAGTDCPPALAAEADRLFPVGRLPEAKFAALDRFIAAAREAGHELRAYDDALDHVARRRDALRRGETLDRLFPDGADSPALAKLLKVPLYPYQAEGALFALRAGRALIADDMGLGKTIQAIAAMEVLARHFGLSRVLVVCPTSLKYQWQSEIARFAGRESTVVSGGRGERRALFAAAGADNSFCLVTNYEKLQADLEPIAAWGPELVIVDEAQRIKNWNTVAARALKRIDSPWALVLTGTPLENKLEELVSIVQFVDQHRLGPTWKLLDDHQVRGENGRVTGYKGLDRIGETLAPIMIRRRKAEVLRQLPVRSDQTILVPMTEPQMELHRDNGETVNRIVTRWRRTGFLSDIDQRVLTAALQRMRMSCVSTWLLDRETDHGVKADELAALLDGVLADPDAKVVVFSQWVRTHTIVIKRLDARGIGYVSFHGDVASDRRPALVQRFRDDPSCRVFLSSDAGASGLNLQHASTLVNMDLPWNPAVLEQRIARIHRLGQTWPVRIVNFVSKGTIQESMLGVLSFKRSLSAGILDGGLAEVALGGSRLTRFMKEVESVAGGTAAPGAAAVAEPEEEMAAQEAAPVQPTEAVEGEAPAVAATAPRWASVSPPAADPWSALLQVGTTLVSALADDSAHHPWIERDAVTGARSLKLPLPPPETARKLADALAGLAGMLRGGGKG